MERRRYAHDPAYLSPLQCSELDDNMYAPLFHSLQSVPRRYHKEAESI